MGQRPRSPRGRPTRTWDEADLARSVATLTDTFLESRRQDRLPQVLAEVAVDLLGVRGSAVTLAGSDGNLAVLAQTLDELRPLEELQVAGPEGGPVLAVSSGAEPTLLDAGGRSDRYPSLAAAAMKLGIRYVYAVPIRRRGETFGSLTLYAEHSGDLGQHERDIARAIADIAATGVVQRRAVAAADLQVLQLEQALASRVVIEQAKGILLAKGQADMDQAFLTLRRYARNRHRPLEDVAREVISRAEDAAEAPLLPHQRTGPHERAVDLGAEGDGSRDAAG